MSKKQVAKNEKVEPIEQSQSAAIINVIERAALNPDVDVEKMERLMAMQERVMARHAEQAFNAALTEMQPNLPAIKQRGKTNNSKYALWEDIQTEITPILSEFGFALSFKTESAENSITITAVLRHSAGHSEQTSLRLPMDNSGSKNQVQSFGSSQSYGMRYTARALLNLNVAGEDDDGAVGGAGPKINETQLDELIKLADEVSADKARFCKYYKISSMGDIPANQFEGAKAALMKKAKTDG